MDVYKVIEQLNPGHFTVDREREWKIVFNSSIEPLAASLKEVRLHIRRQESQRQGFSLVFTTLQTREYYSQGIYSLIHPDIGPLPLFMVPLGLGPDGFMQYEIVIA